MTIDLWIIKFKYERHVPHVSEAGITMSDSIAALGIAAPSITHFPFAWHTIFREKVDGKISWFACSWKASNENNSHGEAKT